MNELLRTHSNDQKFWYSNTKISIGTKKVMELKTDAQRKRNLLYECIREMCKLFPNFFQRCCLQKWQEMTLHWWKTHVNVFSSAQIWWTERINEPALFCIYQVCRHLWVSMFCNAPDYLLDKQSRIERRNLYIIDSESFSPLSMDAADLMCKQIMPAGTICSELCLKPKRCTRTLWFCNSFVQICKSSFLS